MNKGLKVFYYITPLLTKEFSLFNWNALKSVCFLFFLIVLCSSSLLFILSC